MIKFFRNYYFIFILISTSSTFGFTDSDNVLGHYELDESYTMKADILSKLANNKSVNKPKTPFARKNDLDEKFEKSRTDQSLNDVIVFDKTNKEKIFPIKLEVLDTVIYQKSDTSLENPWAKKSDWERINSSRDKQNFINTDRQNFNMKKQNYNIKCNFDLPF